MGVQNENSKTYLVKFETYSVKFETYSVLRDQKTTDAAAPTSLAPMIIMHRCTIILDSIQKILKNPQCFPQFTHFFSDFSPPSWIALSNFPY